MHSGFFLLTILNNLFYVVPCESGNYWKCDVNTCVPCPQGFYQPQWGQTSCWPCPFNTTTDTEGSTSPTECKSKFGKFYCLINGMLRSLYQFVPCGSNINMSLSQDVNVLSTRKTVLAYLSLQIFRESTLQVLNVIGVCDRVVIREFWS